MTASRLALAILLLLAVPARADDLCARIDRAKAKLGDIAYRRTIDILRRDGTHEVTKIIIISDMLFLREDSPRWSGRKIELFERSGLIAQVLVLPTEATCRHVSVETSAGGDVEVIDARSVISGQVLTARYWIARKSGRMLKLESLQSAGSPNASVTETYEYDGVKPPKHYILVGPFDQP